MTRNLWHSCGTFDLDAHFEGKPPVLRETFDRYAALAQACGRVTAWTTIYYGWRPNLRDEAVIEPLGTAAAGLDSGW